MVKYENGELVVGMLDDTKVLSLKTIEKYDYKRIKQDFDELVELLEMNMLFHSIYKERLKYDVDDNLEFRIYVDPKLKDFTIGIEDGNVSYSDTTVFTMDKTMYEQYYVLCEQLLIRIHKAWNHLNEVERFIIKSLEFDNPSSTDEELEDKLMYCNKKYYQYKKSGFIKLGTQLQLEEAKRIKKRDGQIEEDEDRIKVMCGNPDRVV